VYAIGQIVSGQLGNQFSPRKLIALGIVIVALANALMGLQNSLIVMGILWGIGGAGFSLGWGRFCAYCPRRLRRSSANAPPRFSP